MADGNHTGIRRYLAAVTPQDAGSKGRPRIFGWGYGWLAWAGRCTRQQVREAVAAGQLDPSDPVSCIAWAISRRGDADLAERVRAIMSD